MAHLTAKEADELSKFYSKLSMKVAEYRIENWDKLSSAKRLELSHQSRDLGKQSDGYVLQAALLIMHDVKAEMARIKEITEAIEDTILKITSIQKVINVMAAALALGAAILSKNPIDIIEKIESLQKAWNSAKRNLKS